MRLYILVALLLCTSVRAEVVPTIAPLRPNPEFQQSLEAKLAFFHQEMNANSKMTEDEFDGHIVSFITNSPLSEGETVLQIALAYSQLQPPEHELALKHELALRVVMGHALQRMAADDIVASIAPYYELAMSAELRRTLGHCLDMASVRNGAYGLDYRAFSKHIERDKKHPPIRLVGYMFRVNPDKALPEVEKIYSPEKDGELSPRKVEDSIQSVRAIADGGRWWEELYAAEKMRQNRQLRVPELIERLKKSKHEIVREVVDEIEAVKEEGEHGLSNDK